MRKYPAIMLIIAVFELTPLHVKGQTITLDSCFHALEKNHPAWQMEVLQDKQRDFNIQAFKTERLPDVNLTGQVTYQSDVIEIDVELPIPDASFPSAPKDQYKIYGEITQPIYDGGITNAKIKMQQASSAAGIYELQAQQEDIKLQVVSLYGSVRLMQQNDSLYNEMHALVSKQFAIMKNALENGIVTRIEMDLLVAEKLKLEMLQQRNKIKWEQALKQMSLITGTYFADNTKVEPMKAANSFEPSALHEQLRAIQARQETIDARMALNNSIKRPKLYAFSQVGYGNPGLNMLSSGFDYYYIVGATLKWNIWDWNETKYNNKSLAAQHEIAGKHYQNAEKVIQGEILKEKQNIEELQTAIGYNTKIIQIRSDIAGRGAEQLKNGQISAADYIGYLNALLQAQMEFETNGVMLDVSKNRLAIINED